MICVIVGVVPYLLSIGMWPLVVVLAVICLAVIVIRRGQGGSPNRGEASLGDLRMTNTSQDALRPPDVGRLQSSGAQSSRNAVAECRWMGPGTVIEIGPYRIEDPMTYYAEGRPPAGLQYDRFRRPFGLDEGENGLSISEASCIYSGLPIDASKNETEEDTDYWPRYSEISPGQRARYLSWLASGRRGTLRDIGYASLYFYGLERRLLVEKRDRGFILAEVASLLKAYTFSGPFTYYLSNFLAFAIAKRSLRDVDEDEFNLAFADTSVYGSHEGPAIGLAWLWSRSLPLPAELALSIAARDPVSVSSVVCERIPEQFHQLFRTKYRREFGEGLLLKASKTCRRVRYHPASPTLSILSYGTRLGGELTSVSIPDIFGVRGQFSPLAKIWNECVRDLRPFSSKVRQGMSMGNREAYEALPEILRRERDHPDREQWQQVVSRSMFGDGVVPTELAELAKIQGIAECAKLNLKQSVGIAETAGYMGYAIEPDPRITHRAYQWSDKVVVFRAAGKMQKAEAARYVEASAIMELGMCVANADRHIDDREVDRIASWVKGQFDFDDIQTQRLVALKHVLIAQPPDLARVLRRLSTLLSPRLLEGTCALLVAVAAADGVITKSEVSVLKRIYRGLKIDVQRLNELLLPYEDYLEPTVEVATGRRSTAGVERIPPEMERPVERFTLDQARVESLIRESHELAVPIGLILSRADAIEDTEEDAEKVPREIGSRAGTLGLEGRYRSLIEELVESGREEWDRKSFEEVVRKHGLMPGDAVDRINEWAEANLDDLAIEEAESISVNLSVLRGAVLD